MRQQLICASIVAVALPAALLAQDATRSHPPQLIVTGCVERAQRNGSEAGTPVGTSAVSPNSADDEANDQSLVDRYLLTGAIVTAGEGSGKELRAFALQGHDAELREHTGHRVQVTGTLARSRSAAVSRTEKGAASGVQRLAVDSIKMLGASCS